MLKDILRDDNLVLCDIAEIFCNCWNNSTIEEFIYQLIEGNKDICNNIQGWDLSNIGKVASK